MVFFEKDRQPIEVPQLCSRHQPVVFKSIHFACFAYGLPKPSHKVTQLAGTFIGRSYRYESNATSGSIREARLAGNQQANNADTAITTVANKRAPQLTPSSPNTIDSRRELITHAPPKPIPNPMETQIAP